MATYLKFHRLEKSPFEGDHGSRLVLATDALRRAYSEISSGLREDSPRICVGGSPGIGKSSLARALPKLLGDKVQSVLIRDPSISWSKMKASIIQQLGLAGGLLSRSTLMGAREHDERLVLIIDQAEKLPAESLDHLDILLGYRSGGGEQLVQCVLLANLAAGQDGEVAPLVWWLDQLTTLQLTFSPIPERGLRTYVDKHLQKAGWSGQTIFTDGAVVAIHRYTGGVPGAVSALCEELLSRAAKLAVPEIDAEVVAIVCGEPVAAEADREDFDAARDGLDPGDEVLAAASRPALDPEDRPIPAQPPRQPQFDPLLEPELEPEIHQGLQPMEEPELLEPTLGSSPFPARSRSFSPPAQVPGNGRAARFVRNVTAASLLAIIAAAVWRLIPSSEEVLAPVRAATKSIVQVVEDVTAAPDPIPAFAAESDGLTSDLRVPRDADRIIENKVANRPTPELENAPTYEPWSEQRPESPINAAPSPPARHADRASRTTR